MHFASHHAFRFDLHAALGKNDAIKAAGDYHAVSFNLALDLRAFAENDSLLGNNIAFDIAVDAERSGDGQRALKGHTLIDKSGPMFAGAVFCCSGPLPSHVVPPNFYCSGLRT